MNRPASPPQLPPYPRAAVRALALAGFAGVLAPFWLKFPQNVVAGMAVPLLFAAAVAVHALFRFKRPAQLRAYVASPHFTGLRIAHASVAGAMLAVAAMIALLSFMTWGMMHVPGPLVSQVCLFLAMAMLIGFWANLAFDTWRGSRKLVMVLDHEGILAAGGLRLAWADVAEIRHETRRGRSSYVHHLVLRMRQAPDASGSPQEFSVLLDNAVEHPADIVEVARLLWHPLAPPSTKKKPDFKPVNFN